MNYKYEEYNYDDMNTLVEYGDGYVEHNYINNYGIRYTKIKMYKSGRCSFYKHNWTSRTRSYEYYTSLVKEEWDII